MLRLSGQVAVVIGGTGVLGGALAEGLAQAGATVIVAGLDKDRGLACVARIEKAGGKGIYFSEDVASRQSLEELTAETIKQFGQVDILVECAGVNAASDYFEASDEAWQRVFDINLRGAHWACQIFGQEMVKSGRGGAILNIGSVTAHLPLSRVFA